MNVLVAGGTGFLGSYLCDELAVRGHDVTALARHPKEAAFDQSVTVAEGDVTDYDSLDHHFEEVDAVVNLVALSPLFKPSGGDDAHFHVHLGGTENAVRAAENHDVERFVQLSALGAAPDGPTAYIRAKGQAETVVEQSTLDSVIFRPSVLFGDGGEFVPFTRLLAPPYVTPLPGGGTTRFQPIFVAEFAQIVADGVEGTVTGPSTAPDDADATAAAKGDDAQSAPADPDSSETLEETAERQGGEVAGEQEGEWPESGGDAVDPHVGQTYEIGGPQILTLAEVARLAWGAKGRPVNVVSVPMPLAKVGLTLLGLVPGAPMGADQYRSLQFDNTTSKNGIEAFGWMESELTTLSEYLRGEAPTR